MLRGPLPIRYGVNKNHPLNQGLVAWFLTQPALMGGTIWYDLINQIAGPFTGPVTWNSSTRPGGRGGVHFPGNNSSYIVGTANLNMPISNITMGCWTTLTTSSTNGCFVKVGGSPPNGSISERDGYFFGVGSGNMDTPGNNFLGAIEGVAWVDPSVTIGTGAHHLIVTIDISSNWTFFINGQKAGSVSNPGTPITPNARFCIGIDSVDGSTTRSPLCDIDDVRLWTRVLNPGEIRNLYISSQQGYPGVLSYESPVSWFIGTTTVITGKLFRNNTLDGLGSGGPFFVNPLGG